MFHCGDKLHEVLLFYTAKKIIIKAISKYVIRKVVIARWGRLSCRSQMPFGVDGSEWSAKLIGPKGLIRNRLMVLTEVRKDGGSSRSS